MSQELTTIAVKPRSEEILDIIRCHIIAITSASGESEDFIKCENIIPLFDAIHPGFLEDCFQETRLNTIDQMVVEACKSLGSKNVLMKFNPDHFCYPIPEITKPIPEITLLTHPLIVVYKMVFSITKDINLPVEFRRIVRWYKNLYKKNLTPALFAEELNLDPKVCKKYVDAVKDSRLFYVHQNKPLKILANYDIRVAVFKSMTQPFLM
uniref:Uncharacterized protein n=1 Tax=Panagrolaimus superbus TaxID=310955 RepID=A0A914Z5F1_9BILA